MINKIKNEIWLNLKNIPGWSTKRKILVIEADDYGSINIPSKETLSILEEESLVSKNSKGNFDTLETAEDLEALFDVLTAFIDKFGNHAAITPFFNPANPNFQKIREEEFSGYHKKDYRQTLAEYGVDNKINELWQEGIAKGFFKPQYHGREHVNVPFFMKLLQEDNPKMKQAFDLKFCHPRLPEFKNLSSLRRAYYFEDDEQKEFLGNTLIDGIQGFKDYFGFRPTVFCPSNGTFHDDYKPSLFKNGIKAVVESGVRYIPTGDGRVETKRKFKIGEADSKSNLISYSRNIRFEPASDGSKGIQTALKNMRIAYRWGKPAIVATHRSNYCGGIDMKHRENSLILLKTFISQVQQEWPDVEFMDSGRLCELISKDLKQ